MCSAGLFSLVFLSLCKAKEREKEREGQGEGRRSRRGKEPGFFLRRVFFFSSSASASLLLIHSFFNPEFDSPLVFPRGPVFKLRHGFYPPRHASRRSVLAVAALIEAMQAAPRR